MTLYTVGSIKRIPGYKQYAAVDGGMTDNPRYALYQSRYTVYHGSKTGPTERFDVVGRCCESGDIIQPHVELPGRYPAGAIFWQSAPPGPIITPWPPIITACPVRPL